MKRSYLFSSIALSLLGVADAFADNGSSLDSSMPLLFTVLIIWFIVSLLISVRIWKVSNDIKALKAKICTKGLAEKSIMRSEVMKLHLLNKDDEAFEILNDALYNEARKLFISTNDGKDYKGMVFHQSEEGVKKVSCNDMFDIKWAKTIEKYKPLYDAINQPVPDVLKTIGYQYIKDFGKGATDTAKKDDKPALKTEEKTESEDGNADAKTDVKEEIKNEDKKKTKK